MNNEAKTSDVFYRLYRDSSMRQQAKKRLCTPMNRKLIQETSSTVTPPKRRLETGSSNLEIPLNHVINVKSPYFKPKVAKIQLTENLSITHLPSEEKQETVPQRVAKALREKGNARFNSLEEPPDLLDMSVIERTKFYFKHKAMVIEEKQKEITDKEMNECSFQPQITRRSCSKTAITPKPQRSNSYAERNIRLKKKK